MSTGALLLWLLALALGLLALRRGAPTARKGLKSAGQRFLTIMPRIGLALLAAGFIAKLVPSELIVDLIGPESGLGGVLIASLVGGFVPAGPIVSFPLVVVLYKAGAGVPQLVAFLTAWSVFAFHRVLIYETTLMGWRFSAVRLLSSLILPPLSGLIAAGILAAVSA